MQKANYHTHRNLSLFVVLLAASLLALLWASANDTSVIRKNVTFLRWPSMVTATAIARPITNDSTYQPAPLAFNNSRDVSSSRRRLSTAPNYRIFTFRQLSRKARRLANQYPNFLQVTTAQDRYSLPAAGGKRNYILFIQDYIAHPLDSDSSNRLPEVFWSGALHGDERVGPTSVIEAARLLLQAATCEAALTVTCKQELLTTFGITDTQRQWLARLVSTRRIVIVPNANALGYAQNVREENGYDPNRDFPYDLNDKNCMKTVAARVLNEVFREHMFQMALTFHGGMEAIGYEWGAPSYPNKSPDDRAQNVISAAFSYHGGSFTSSPKYEYGDMNSLVYPVRGGMEDWAYAGSWDTANVNTECDGYPKAKVTYNPGTLRAFNILVEISNEYTPLQSTLGSGEDVLSRTSAGNGYVSRTLRIALMSAELVEPYVLLKQVNGNSLDRDIVPSVKRGGRKCKTTRTITVPAGTQSVSFMWQVGGAITVDSTSIWYAKWNTVPAEKLDCITQPLFSDVTSYFNEGTISSATSGIGLYSSQSGAGTNFTGTVPTAGYTIGDSIVVLVSVQVDRDWSVVPALAKPILSPQSHIVNARTNPSWWYKSNDKIVSGRLNWFSIPYTITIG